MPLNNIQMISLLNTISIPSFYDHADKGQALPFIAIHVNQPMGFRADNGNYVKRWEFRLDLYTVKKNLSAEAEIEALLDEYGIPWDQSEQYLEDQSCWESEYTFDILGEVPPPEPDPPKPDPPEPDPPEPDPPEPDPTPDGDGDG